MMKSAEAKVNAPKKKTSRQESHMALKQDKGITVLLVDDEPESVLPLKRILQDCGCTVYFLNRPLEAEKFLSYNDEINLVFLDWNMPDVEGGEVLTKVEQVISGDHELSKAWFQKNIPVVTYTAEDQASLNLPMTPHFAFIDFWPKSTKLSDLRLQVESVLSFLQNRGH